MNEMRATSGAGTVHDRVPSMDIAPADDVKGNDERDARTAALVATNLPNLPRAAHLKRVAAVHAKGTEVSARLDQGLLDDTVTTYLAKHGWEAGEIQHLVVTHSMNEADDSVDLKEALLWMVIQQAVDKKNVEVFLVIPKTEELIKRTLQYLSEKDDSAVYAEMRGKVHLQPIKSKLHKLIGPDAQ